MNDKPENGVKTPTKRPARGPSEEELKEIHALYAQADAIADALAETKGEAGTSDQTGKALELVEDGEACPVTSSVQSSSMDSDPEQGDPR